jgi:hypothetical protein
MSGRKTPCEISIMELLPFRGMGKYSHIGIFTLLFMLIVLLVILIPQVALFVPHMVM